MKSRTPQIIILIAIGIGLIIGIGYAIARAIPHGNKTTITDRNHIRINKNVRGTVDEVLTGTNMLTVKDDSGQEIQVGIVPETRISNEKGTSVDPSVSLKGSTIEVEGESIAPNAMIASDIRITATPEIIVLSPVQNTIITSPLIVEGLAKGTWYFEANLPIEIVDARHRSLGKKYATATKDWMSESLVPFKGEIEFQKPGTRTGYLILRKDNPSGMKGNEKSFEVPIDFEPPQKMTVKAFFNNSNLDPAFLCDKVFPVSREVAWTEGVGRAAIEELLKGPSEQERSMNYFSNINPNVKIDDLTVDNGTARVDFSDELGKNIAGSCRVTAIRSQIAATLKQFPTVSNVIISINGRIDDILQP